MNPVTNNNLPWQYFPEKFIRFAGQFETSNDEFERLTGYLILDLGVETLCKVYLLMANSDTIKYKKREEIATGTISKNLIPDSGITAADFDTANFHILVESVKKISDYKISDEDIKRVEYFHKLRNNLYHQGVKSAPPKKDFDEYLALAEMLFATLLNTNKKAKDTLADNEPEKAMHEISLVFATFGLEKDFQDFRLNIIVAAEVFNPKYTSRKFEKSLKKIQSLYPDNEDDSVSNRYESQSRRIERFNDLTGEDTEDIDFINNAIQDMTYLCLFVLYDNEIIEEHDINNYIEYRTFVRRFGNDPEKASRGDREELLQLQDWAKKIEEKLNTLDPKHKSDNQKEEDK